MKRILIAIGGNELKKIESEIFKEMVRLAGGRAACIAVIPTASEIPEERGRAYTALFSKFRPSSVDVLPVDSRAAASDPAHLRVLQEATLVMFTGGNQLRLTAIFAGTPLDRVLRERYEAGCVVAGSSAGAAAMGEVMISQSYGSKNHRRGGLEITQGLGLIRGVAFDTHFVQRNRVSRLVHAVATNPGLLGLGVDENTALIVEDEARARCVGAGTVIAIDGRDVRGIALSRAPAGRPSPVSGLTYSVYTAGESIDLRSRGAHRTKRVPVHILRETAAAFGGE